jgi:hypothetical protein
MAAGDSKDPGQRTARRRPVSLAVVVILMGAFEIALYAVGVRGLWFALAIILGVVVLTRYRWHGRFLEEGRARAQAREERRRKRRE